MSEMVERVARALARADGAKITGPSRHKASDEFKWDAGHRYMDSYVEKHWQEHRTSASMAIEAMREMTPEMRKSWENLRHNHQNQMIETVVAYHWWPAAIDAALT